MLADSLATASMISLHHGRVSTAASPYPIESFQISKEIDNLWGQSYSRFMVGDAYWERGQPDLALEMMEHCLRVGEEAGFMPAQILSSRARLALGLCLSRTKRGLRPELAERTRSIWRDSFSDICTWASALAFTGAPVAGPRGGGYAGGDDCP